MTRIMYSTHTTYAVYLTMYPLAYLCISIAAAALDSSDEVSVISICTHNKMSDIYSYIIVSKNSKPTAHKKLRDTEFPCKGKKMMIKN